MPGSSKMTLKNFTSFLGTAVLTFECREGKSAKKSIFARFWTPLGLHLGFIFDPFWHHVAVILGPFWLHFDALGAPGRGLPLRFDFYSLFIYFLDPQASHLGVIFAQKSIKKSINILIKFLIVFSLILRAKMTSETFPKPSQNHQNVRKTSPRTLPELSRTSPGPPKINIVGLQT